MNKHLKLVREFHDAFSFPQAEHGKKRELSEMDIVRRQSLLMEEGSKLFLEINAGDIVEVLAGMINLSYCALSAIAIQGEDVLDRPVSWQHDGHVISLMRLFCDKINNCSSGSTDNYSEVYCLCLYLSRNFINADFDKAFQLIHDNKMSRLGRSGKLAEEILKSKFLKAPDLSDALYE